MMRASILMALLPTIALAQGPAVLQDSTTRAVDADVWKPYVKAFNTRNADVFTAVHAKDAIRWPLGYTKPQGKDSIAVQAKRNWSAPPPPDESRTIELYFTHRSHTEAFEFDVGYYRVIVKMPKGSGVEYYGHFSTILGKEDGKWKIFLDADNASGVRIEDLGKGVLFEAE